MDLYIKQGTNFHGILFNPSFVGVNIRDARGLHTTEFR